MEDFQKKLDARIAVLSKERDKLRDLESEISSLGDEVEEAIDCLNDAKHSIENAADALSTKF